MVISFSSKSAPETIINKGIANRETVVIDSANNQLLVSISPYILKNEAKT
jgi:hypothetical protein